MRFFERAFFAAVSRIALSLSSTASYEPVLILISSDFASALMPVLLISDMVLGFGELTNIVKS